VLLYRAGSAFTEEPAQSKQAELARDRNFQLFSREVISCRRSILDNPRGFDPYEYAKAWISSTVFRHRKDPQIYPSPANKSYGRQKQPREAHADMGSLV